MTVPFRVEPESVKRPAQDPFLEFESERPSKQLLGSDQVSKTQPQDDFPQLTRPAEQRPDVDSDSRNTSAINPSVAFALGVAGLVTAAVGYYQMGQLLADRSHPPAASQAAVQGESPVGPAASPAATRGKLDVESDPAGATVTIDGVGLGVTPLSLPNMVPGTYEVVITRGQISVTRSVEVAAGGTASVAAVLSADSTSARATTPAPATPTPPVAPSATRSVPGAAAGWVTFDSPLELNVLNRGKAQGTTRGRMSLAAGSYQLELVNDALEIRQVVTANVSPGQGIRVAVPIPTGVLSVNALPWADVWIDGNPVGTTPLANLKVPVGTHEVVLRHPSLGERKQSVVVKAITPARLGVDLKR
jgi:serine/threonine-protein kinase